MTIYSHSRLSLFEQCQLKYKFRYIDKLSPDYENSIEAFLGKKVHETLEWLYTKKNERIIELDYVVAFYIEQWNQSFNDGIRVIKEDTSVEYYFNKGIRFLINYFMKNYPYFIISNPFRVCSPQDYIGVEEFNGSQVYRGWEKIIKDLQNQFPIIREGPCEAHPHYYYFTARVRIEHVDKYFGDISLDEIIARIDSASSAVYQCHIATKNLLEIHEQEIAEISQRLLRTD
ncbi:PD-(D/E)XK nuclease family protein [Candidatus Pacearchaeota archaeon]|nr:PD-(D/E)XK nuclease family protein [Candidatus Pacearchaeota archaeon]